eukprot:1103248-Rhodomonas_salina.1
MPVRTMDDLRREAQPQGGAGTGTFVSPTPNPFAGVSCSVQTSATSIMRAACAALLLCFGGGQCDYRARGGCVQHSIEYSCGGLRLRSRPDHVLAARVGPLAFLKIWNLVLRRATSPSAGRKLHYGRRLHASR